MPNDSDATVQNRAPRRAVRVDRRVARTERALGTALVELMLARRFEDRALDRSGLRELVHDLMAAHLARTIEQRLAVLRPAARRRASPHRRP